MNLSLIVVDLRLRKYLQRRRAINVQLICCRLSSSLLNSCYLLKGNIMIKRLNSRAFNPESSCQGLFNKILTCCLIFERVS